MPLHYDYKLHYSRKARKTYLVSRCGWCLRQNGQNFLNSRRSVVVFLFFVLL
jgi:hypothetical protein